MSTLFFSNRTVGKENGLRTSGRAAITPAESAGKLKPRFKFRRPFLSITCAARVPAVVAGKLQLDL
jgi:hypothetical protein